MNGKYWVAAGALLLSFQATMASAQASLETLRRQALELTNEARAEADLPALSLDETLNEAAQGHASNMLERDFYAHKSPNGDTPLDRFLAAGGSKWSVAGENIAKCTGCQAPADVERVTAFHEGWMQSQDHRENILSDGFDSFGFGIAGEGNEIYAVQTFSGPGSNPGEESETLTTEEIREAALQDVNEYRTAQSHEPLRLNSTLNTLAERLLQELMTSGSIPENIFADLPESAAGWTSIALRSATRGGSGTGVTRSEVTALVEAWRSAVDANPFGGVRATEFGLATQSNEEGRTTALGVFGGRR